MKNLTMTSLLVLLFAHTATAKTVENGLFEVNANKLVSAEVVGDSVFGYTADEITCDPEADEEEPCLATVDHWASVCFKGQLEAVCPAFETLFKASSEQLLSDGAEEDVELLSCSSESGITVMSYNLISGHGGPNVQIKDKMIPMCPIFF